MNFRIPLILVFLYSCIGKSPKTQIVHNSKESQNSTLENNSPKQKKIEVPLDTMIGQMIMVGINDRTYLPSIDSLKNDLKYKIGGIILFEKNIAKDSSYYKMQKLIKELQKESLTPLFIAIDEEGGKVHRLKEKYGFVSMPSAEYMGSFENTDSTFFYSQRLAKQLHDLGINLNFAPTVDVASNPNNPIIAKVKRSFSANPEKVGEHSLAFIKGHHLNKVHTTLKHFPGHGSSAADTHKGMVDVTKQWQFSELIPYKNIIEAGQADAILSCHVINCRLDTTCVPSTLSKIITTELLREVIGFKGVVFSDDMQMYAISKNYGLEQSIKMAINAGVDVLVFGNNVTKTDRISASKIHQIIKKHVLNGDIPKSRIEEAFNRIMKMKEDKF